MGNTLAPMQRELTLIDSDTSRDAKETLDRLEDMAEDRIELFYDKIGYIASALTHLIALTFCIFAVVTIVISTSSPSTRCSTSTPTLVLRWRKGTIGSTKSRRPLRSSPLAPSPTAFALLPPTPSLRCSVRVLADVRLPRDSKQPHWVQ